MFADVIHLRPAVRFREFPFGTATDPSLRTSMAAQPWPDQDRALAYLRSGHVLSLTMGADLSDPFDRPHKANPRIGDRVEGGTTLMTDGTWFWYAGLIHFVEKYNVRLPDAFLAHAAARGWHVPTPLPTAARYEASYFLPGATAAEAVHP